MRKGDGHAGAKFCLLTIPEDFEQTLFIVVDAGHDADTVAAMARTVVGAYHGYAKLPRRLVADLEFHDRIADPNQPSLLVDASLPVLQPCAVRRRVPHLPEKKPMAKPSGNTEGPGSGRKGPDTMIRWMTAQTHSW